jgi:hypothetical protein
VRRWHYVGRVRNESSGPMSVLFKIELSVECDEKKYLLAKHVIKQVALQAYARVALLDDGPKPEITACSHSDEGRRIEIPLVEFTRTHDEEFEAVNGRVGEAMSVTCPSEVRKPVLRVIAGGRSPTS